MILKQKKLVYFLKFLLLTKHFFIKQLNCATSELNLTRGLVNQNEEVNLFDFFSNCYTFQK